MRVMSVTHLRNLSLLLIPLEGATVKSMRVVRWRRAPNETPHVLEGSGLTTAPVDGMGGDEAE